MIRSSDIDNLLRRRDHQGESVEDWCRRHDVDESVMHRVVQAYGVDRASAVAAIDAFRLGHEARRSDEPKGQRSAGWAAGGPRYAVQFVVIDTADGHILGDPTGLKDYAEDLAGSYNELDSQTVDRGL